MCGAKWIVSALIDLNDFCEINYLPEISEALIATLEKVSPLIAQLDLSDTALNKREMALPLEAGNILIFPKATKFTDLKKTR